MTLIEPDDDLPENPDEPESIEAGNTPEASLDDAQAPTLDPVANDDLGGDPAAMNIGDIGGGSGGSAFMGVPIEVTISVGKARPLVNELVKLRRDSVIGLDTKIDDPVEVYIGDKLIARGELEEMEDGEGQLAVRLTEVADVAGGA